MDLDRDEQCAYTYESTQSLEQSPVKMLNFELLDKENVIPQNQLRILDISPSCTQGEDPWEQYLLCLINHKQFNQITNSPQNVNIANPNVVGIPAAFKKYRKSRKSLPLF